MCFPGAAGAASNLGSGQQLTPPPPPSGPPASASNAAGVKAVQDLKAKKRNNLTPLADNALFADKQATAAIGG